MKRALTAFAAGVLLLPLAACGGANGAGGDQTINVFAAASLTTAFTEIGAEFEKAHHGVRVRFNFGGSSDLVTEIRAGAPADVFASADTTNMDKLTGDGTATRPKRFATNVLEIATPPGNPAGVKSFADLGRSGLKVVVCAPEVPCGAATSEMEQKTGTVIKPVSEEQSVTDVLGKVESGEADAGVVYVTDVKAAGDKVTGVPFPESGQVVNTYPIAALKGSSDAAHQFVDFVLGDQGQKVLADAGFGKP